MFTVLELFDLASQIEANGEQFYRYALTRVRRDSFIDLLGWLADQELLHKSAFAGMKEKIAGGGEPVPSFPSLSREVLRGAMGRHAFSLDELRIDSIRDEEEILKAALLFEEDTIMFFEFISPFISDPVAISVLEKIREEESHHKQLLMEKIVEIQTKSPPSRKS
jgi:rubrerythrin